jgi:hypothetical protein
MRFVLLTRFVGKQRHLRGKLVELALLLAPMVELQTKFGYEAARHRVELSVLGLGSLMSCSSMGTPVDDGGRKTNGRALRPPVPKFNTEPRQLGGDRTRSSGGGGIGVSHLRRGRRNTW